MLDCFEQPKSHILWTGFRKSFHIFPLVYIQSFPCQIGVSYGGTPKSSIFLIRFFHEINHPSYWGTFIGNPDSSFPGDAGVAHQESWTAMGFEVRTKHFMVMRWDIPSGYLTVCHGKSPFLIGKPSISMGHLYHGYVSHNQRVTIIINHY